MKNTSKLLKKMNKQISFHTGIQSIENGEDDVDNESECNKCYRYPPHPAVQAGIAVTQAKEEGYHWSRENKC